MRRGTPCPTSRPCNLGAGLIVIGLLTLALVISKAVAVTTSGRGMAD